MRCCSCGGESFGEVIDLGSMPLVNNLLSRPDDDCPRWPLKVVYCRNCSLAQLTETPPPEAMFSEYLYFSSQSHTMVAHAGDLARRFVKPGQRVVEIASNDGYLLRQAQARGAKVLGVDPASNIAEVAKAAGVSTRCEYFNADTARNLVDDFGKADVIFANNVLAHVPDPNEIAAGIRIALADGGVAHIEVPSIQRMIESTAFDTIYHEHHCYFSLIALKQLFNRHGLRVTDAQTIDIHGGSLHVQLALHGNEETASAMCAQEESLGLRNDSFYAGFSGRVWNLKAELERALARFNRIAAVGAAAKGVILLNSFGLDCDHIPWVTDVSPHKQGRYVPGTRQEIVSPERLIREMPEAALILPWNIKDEIVSRNQEYQQRGGRFVIPIPKVMVL